MMRQIILLLLLIALPFCAAHNVPLALNYLSYEDETIILQTLTPVWINASDAVVQQQITRYFSEKLLVENGGEECAVDEIQIYFNETPSPSLYRTWIRCDERIDDVYIENSLFYDVFGYMFEQYTVLQCGNEKRFFYNDMYNTSISFSATTVCGESSEEMRQAAVRFNNNTYSTGLLRRGAEKAEPVHARLEESDGTITARSTEDTDLSLFNSIVDKAKSGEASLLLIIILSFFLGMLHTMSPGHGKSVIVSYLLGKDANVKNVLVIALSTAITHISDVFIVSLLLLFLIPRSVKPFISEYLSLASAILIMVFGLYMLVKNLRHHHHHHEHKKRGLIIAGVIVGLAPCPTAWALYLVMINLGLYFKAFISILSFGTALLLTISAIGIVFIKAKKLMKKIPGETGFATRLPLISSVLILLIGMFLVIKNVI